MSASQPPAKISVLLNHPKAVVSHIELQPGGIVPRHAHPTPYVLHPHTDGKVRRTTYQGSTVIKTEDVDYTKDQPFYVDAGAPGTETTIENLSPHPVLSSKIQIR
jgi:hypothetical protein